MNLINYGRIHLMIFSLFILCCVYFFGTNAEGENNALIWVESENGDSDGVVTVEEENEESFTLSNDVFQPTAEWQEVKPDQAIPRGLHVRLNLETGKKEAKLMEDSNKFQYWSDGQRKGIVNNDHKFFTMSELKKALKEFDKSADEIEIPEETKQKEQKEKYRPYEELKRDFEIMNRNFKTESEIITDLIKEYNLPNSTNDRKLQILLEFEYLTHQIDNAQNFVDLNGFNIVKDGLNSSHDTFREASAFLLGTACQNNPKVQIAALDNGLLHQILRAFSAEKNFDVRKKYLFAVSSLLRHFPFAQKKFLDLGGVDMFENVFRHSGNEKEKLKVIALLHSLFVEKQEAEFLARGRNEALIEKWRQYRDIDFVDAFVKVDLCSHLAELLRYSSNYDAQETILRTMNITMNYCDRNVADKFYSNLMELKQSYERNMMDNAENDYLMDLNDLLNHVISKILVKDEL